MSRARKILEGDLLQFPYRGTERYIVRDREGNVQFKGKKFYSFDDAFKALSKLVEEIVNEIKTSDDPVVDYNKIFDSFQIKRLK